jgi:putative Mn2+ efflux pump MntP
MTIVIIMSKNSEKKSPVQFYSSITSAPLMTIAGMFIGYYGGESISPGLGTIGALLGALFFFMLGLIEIFNIIRKENKAQKEKLKFTSTINKGATHPIDDESRFNP